MSNPYYGQGQPNGYNPAGNSGGRYEPDYTPANNNNNNNNNNYAPSPDMSNGRRYDLEPRTRRDHRKAPPLRLEQQLRLLVRRRAPGPPLREEGRRPQGSVVVVVVVEPARQGQGAFLDVGPGGRRGHDRRGGGGRHRAGGGAEEWEGQYWGDDCGVGAWWLGGECVGEGV
ncbi:hypothetical protein HO173_009574 [Letharia columbiana]|uniref:Uncharacterized protein n=1 Tax=Letharia columbiana TaxID=112416 RepID=A0A8H6L1Q0_9LECA|nr:uncharacterized protein HO173_009574 [Letharia columbiana]KAF6232191.1 hypothetical protein HO173_009574 [Letharia columbiana]